MSTGMNNSWEEKDKASIWHPYTSLLNPIENIVLDSAQGAYLYAEDGRKILDAISSWWVNLHGHAHPYINSCLAAQVNKLEHAIFAGFTHKPAITLAERLLPLLPGEQTRIFYSDNGSTAVEIALKMALQYKVNNGLQPGKIIALDGAFHGDTFGAMSVSERGVFTKHFTPYLFEVEFIPFPEEGKEEETLGIFTEVVKGNCTAFIYEPLVQGAGGMRIYSPELLEKLLQIAKKAGVVCIADEVMTGFGRTGKLFASSYMDTKPDILCLSKGITGGYMPFGATTCNKVIESAFLKPEIEKTLFHGHSYTGNAMACAIANASLDLLLKKDCLENIDFISKYHIQFKEEIKGHAAIRKIDALGTILSIEFRTLGSSGYTNSMRNELYNFFINRNILIRPLGNVIYVLPPYIVQKEELDYIYESIRVLLKNKAN